MNAAREQLRRDAATVARQLSPLLWALTKSRPALLAHLDEIFNFVREQVREIARRRGVLAGEDPAPLDHHQDAPVQSKADRSAAEVDDAA